MLTESALSKLFPTAQAGADIGLSCPYGMEVWVSELWNTENIVFCAGTHDCIRMKYSDLRSYRTAN